MKKFAVLFSLGMLVFGCVPGSASAAEAQVNYQTHIENIGWETDANLGLKSDGEISGTEGKSLRLEAIKIQTNIEGLGVAYQTHIENIGWESYPNKEWNRNGEMSGTEGRSLRLEAIQIKLTGLEASNYDIYYQVHAQNYGWLAWAKNGESAGTQGYSDRLEAIRIVIVKKGEQPPTLETSVQPQAFYKNDVTWNSGGSTDIPHATDGAPDPWSDGSGKGESQ